MSKWPERVRIYKDDYTESLAIIRKARKYGVKLDAYRPIASLRAAFNFNPAIKETHVWTRLK